MLKFKTIAHHEYHALLSEAKILQNNLYIIFLIKSLVYYFIQDENIQKNTII